MKRSLALQVNRGGAHAWLEVRGLSRRGGGVARLRHANGAEIYDMGAGEGWPCFSLELGGGTLLTHLAGAPRLPEQAADLVRTPAAAMQADELSNWGRDGSSRWNTDPVRCPWEAGAAAKRLAHGALLLAPRHLSPAVSSRLSGACKRK